jgi:hypothetical protein
MPEEGFSPRFSFSRIGDYHVKIVPERLNEAATIKEIGILSKKSPVQSRNTVRN